MADSQQLREEEIVALGRRNKEEWGLAEEKLGISRNDAREQLQRNNPEYKQAADRVITDVKNLTRNSTLIAAVAGMAITAGVFAFGKKIASKWPSRAVLALTSGVGASVMAGFTSAYIGGKRLIRDTADSLKAENKALEQEIQAAVAKTDPASAENKDSPKFTAAVTPREPCHAAQVAKDAAQPGVPMVGA